jgi:hypothetical protein
MLKTNQEYLDQIKKVGEYNLKDTNKWRERAMFFQEKAGKNWSQGYYTDLIEGTLDWEDFWDEEERRIQEGLWIDGFYIPGLFYFYLNYLPIYRKQDNEYNFPDVYDSDYHTFLCLEHAVFLKKHFGVIKKRQCIDENTLIDTPNGSFPIKDLFKVQYRGEVFSLGLDNELIIDNISEIWPGEETDEIYRIKISENKFIDCLDSHLIRTEKGFRHVGTLKVGDKITYLEETSLINFPILEIEIIKEKRKTYDLSTDKSFSYFANGFHVHNSGFSLKFCAPLIRELWFSRGSPNYIATYEEPQVQKAWAEILEPYREHLNVYTPWYRDLNPDKTMNWRVAKEMITETGRKVTKGRMNSLKGLVLSKSASKGVGGGAKWIFADESGVNPVLSKFLGYIKPMITYGNVTTGTIIASGAVGELKHLDGGLKDIIVNPEAQNFYWVENIWDKDNEYAGKRCGFFVPESWAYFGVDEEGVPFVDEYGNSDVKRAEEYILRQREEIKKQSLESYMFAISQAPLSLMECFQYRNESVFPKDIIDHQIAAIELKEDHGTYVDLYETSGKIVKHKLLSKFENQPILDFPVKPKEIKNKDGVIQIWEFPMENPPYGLYWAGVDICRDSESLNSPSIHCIDIFKGAHKLSEEFAAQKPVASYRCRPKDKMDFYKKALMLIEYFNAEALVENNVRWFIQEAIKDRKQHKISKTPKWLMDITPNATSQLTSPYGVPMTTKLKEELIDTLISYVSEVIYITYDEITGEPTEHFGVERIKNVFVLKEMIAWKPIKDQNSKDNYDNLISLGLAIMSAQKAEMLGIVQDDSVNDSLEDLIRRKNAKLITKGYISKTRTGYVGKTNGYLHTLKKNKNKN